MRFLKDERGKGFVFSNLKQMFSNRRFRSFAENNPVYNALLRNTVTPTILKGGEKVNVIPAESSISFDAFCQQRAIAISLKRLKSLQARMLRLFLLVQGRVIHYLQDIIRSISEGSKRL